MHCNVDASLIIYESVAFLFLPQSQFHGCLGLCGSMIPQDQLHKFHVKCIKMFSIMNVSSESIWWSRAMVKITLRSNIKLTGTMYLYTQWSYFGGSLVTVKECRPIGEAATLIKRQRVMYLPQGDVERVLSICY